MNFTLGRILKRKNIDRKDFRRILEEKYNHSVSMSTINTYCLKEYPSPHPCWKVIRECLEKEYGIVYENGMWKEVMTDGRE